MTTPDPSMPARALAVRLPNWVGDVCMVLPALALLTERGFAVRAFGKGWAPDLLAGMPIAVERLPKGLGAAAAALRAAAASGAAPDGLLFTNSFGSALQMRLAGRRALGYRKELRGLLLARALPRARGIHEVEAFWRLAAALLDSHGLAPAPAVIPDATLPVSASHREQAAAALAAHGVTGPYAVLCPLAVGLIDGRSKQWPSFPLLCRGLIEGGETVIGCPGPGEEAACAAALPGAVLLNGLGLGAYASVLAGARRVVANDSGPMHLAAAAGAPVLGIFGVSDPARTRPWSRRGATVGDGRGWPTVQAVRESLGRLPGPDEAAQRGSMR